jgi:hypothetical protein
MLEGLSLRWEKGDIGALRQRAIEAMLKLQVALLKHKAVTGDVVKFFSGGPVNVDMADKCV